MRDDGEGGNEKQEGNWFGINPMYFLLVFVEIEIRNKVERFFGNWKCLYTEGECLCSWLDWGGWGWEAEKVWQEFIVYLLGVATSNNMFYVFSNLIWKKKRENHFCFCFHFCLLLTYLYLSSGFWIGFTFSHRVMAWPDCIINRILFKRINGLQHTGGR